jgi:transcriptional regulator GlxA family with amidase domain
MSDGLVEYRRMRIAMLLYAGFQLLDVSGPMDVFQEANRLAGKTFYEQQLVGPSAGPVLCSNGTAVGATASLREAGTAFDIVVVPGAPAAGAERRHRDLVDWLSLAGRRARKLVSVSNGAFLIAHAGLADHRWLIAHGRDAQRLADAYPRVRVTRDLHCLKDGNLYSSDGASAGMRVALALVEEDLGERAAKTIANALSM